MVAQDFREPEPKHVCGCNLPGCYCAQLVENSGQVCDYCKDDMHLYTKPSESDVDDDHDYLVD